MNTTNLPRFLEFLTNVAEAVASCAQEDNAGTVTYEIVQLKESTEDSNGLSAVKLTHTDCVTSPLGDSPPEDVTETEWYMFAAGQHRRKNMVKIQQVDNDNDDFVMVSSNPNAILAIITY